FIPTFTFVLLLAALLVAQPIPGGGPGPRAYPADLKPAFADVAYADLSPAQKLDLFLPAGPGPFPLLLNIHGGAFMFGDKTMLDAPVARAFLAAGFAVASVNYRLSGEARFPAAVQDVKAAVRHLRARAADYRLDGRIVAFGQSAGGNLASLLGTSGGEALFEDARLGHAETSSRVQAVIDWFGPTDFAQMDAQAKAEGRPASAQTHGTADSPESRYLGAALATVPELVRQANPATYATPDDPPFLLQKGSADPLIPVGQSRLLLDALRRANVSATLEIIEGGGHGDMGSGQARFLTPENIARLVTFARQNVPPKP
ncbi:MAG: hypothetical protein RL376_1070, partial [Verrucomicrobiota bacterium]